MYSISDLPSPCSPDGKINKKKLRAMATREKILAAAMQSFAEAGYSGCSLDNIAQAAEITKGAIYTHFDTKLDLFIAIIQYAYERASDKAREVEMELPWPQPITALLRECRTNPEFPINHKLWAEILAVAGREPKVKSVFLHYHGMFRKHIVTMLENALSENNKYGKSEIENLASFLFVLGNGLIVRLDEHDSCPTYEDFKIFEKIVITSLP